MTRPSTESDYAERMVEIRHEEGLHMRPAMQFVDCANNFESQINVQKDKQIVDAKSIMQVTMLAATRGTILKCTARGRDARQAVEALAKILEDGIPPEEGQEKTKEKGPKQP